MWLKMRIQLRMNQCMVGRVSLIGVCLLGHTTSPGIPAGTCESTCEKPAKNPDPEGSGLMDPSPDQIQVTSLKK